jgi:DNA-binding response OmpR family regulator
MQMAGNVLIFDDDQDIADMIKMMLEYKGFAVFIAQSAAQIAAIMRNNTIDVAILDMLAGTVNGIDICKHLKENNDTAHLPVIMISGLSDARKICIEAGADDFIPKPFEMNYLLSKINNLIGLPQ